MPIINIVKPFMLQMEHGKLTEYMVGRYEVTDEVRTDRYTQAHLEGYAPPPPATGTDQQAVLLATQAARLNEVVEAQKPEAPPPPAKDRAVQFAGRKNLPKPPSEMPSFIDPRG